MGHKTILSFNLRFSCRESWALNCQSSCVLWMDIRWTASIFIHWLTLTPFCTIWSSLCSCESWTPASWTQKTTSMTIRSCTKSLMWWVQFVSEKSGRTAVDDHRRHQSIFLGGLFARYHWSYRVSHPARSFDIPLDECRQVFRCIEQIFRSDFSCFVRQWCFCG